MIKNEMVSAVLKISDKFVMFLDKENGAPDLDMKILFASKAAKKKDCMDSLTGEVMLKLKWFCRGDKLTYNTLQQFALLQQILRYDCRHVILPRDSALLCSRMKSRIWSMLNFNSLEVCTRGNSETAHRGIPARSASSLCG